jgi:hypothetical protein
VSSTTMAINQKGVKIYFPSQKHKENRMFAMYGKCCRLLLVLTCFRPFARSSRVSGFGLKIFELED